MTEKIRFVKHIRKSVIHNPMMNNALDTQELEIRKDPLTGTQSVFNPRLEDKVAMFYGKSDTALIEKIAIDSQANCFLCGDTWKKITPTYPEELVPEGRIQIGQAVLFPNIFPVAQIHAVIRVGDKHYVPLSEFDPTTVADAFATSLELARYLEAAKAGVKYLTINGNYLGPAGASIAHPHFQVVGGDLPFTYLENILDLSRQYFQKNQSCFWNDLPELEKAAKERYIGASGPVEWLASFSPSGTNEIVGVLPKRSHFLEWDTEDVNGLAQGFVKVLRGYAEMGISTFNFAIYSGPLGETDESFRCFIRIISRQNVYKNYRTDDYFLQKLLDNELILTPPEMLAKNIQQHFE
jgi:UDPglucose--hexose-1-phosphate uridylyltransferase